MVYIYLVFTFTHKPCVCIFVLLQHKLKVIAVDGTDIEPEEADYIIIHSGERYDVEIRTNANVGNYWIRLEDLTTQDVKGVIYGFYINTLQILVKR